MHKQVQQVGPPSDRIGAFNATAFRLLIGVVCFLIPDTSWAQRPFQQYDQLYRSEQSQRSFYGSYALTAEVAYRNASSIRSGGYEIGQSNPMGVSFRLDYQLAQQLDFSAMVDAAGNSTRRNLSLSWLVFKYYERNESSTFALRLAVDPSFDSRVGFPQIDAAWISSSTLSPVVSSEFAIGLRRVRLGYEQSQIVEPGLLNGYQLHDVGVFGREIQKVNTRAFGWEFHLTFGYNFKVDPAGSNFFVTVLGHAGSYDLLETSQESVLNGNLPAQLAAATSYKKEIETSSDYLGGVVWLRSGFEFNRPNILIMPYIGLPVQQWAPDSGDWPRSRRQVGVRLMLR